MKCTDKKTAERIAFFGARKMDEQGYRYEQVGGSWLMTTPQGDKTYWVATKDAAGNALCDCAFFAENKELLVCKHIARARWMEADQATEVLRIAEEDSFGIIIRPTTQMEIGDDDMEEARTRIGQWYGGEYHN